MVKILVFSLSRLTNTSLLLYFFKGIQLYSKHNKAKSKIRLSPRKIIDEIPIENNIARVSKK